MLKAAGGSRQYEDDVESMQLAMKDAFHAAAALTLPLSKSTPKRPWISQSTLDLIDARNGARSRGDADSEASITREIKKAVRLDRRAWLDSMAASKDWSQLRQLRKRPAPRQGRLRNFQGELVSSEERADTMAKHLETVQWAVRPVTVAPARPDIGCSLPVALSEFSLQEVRAAAKKLRTKRATGVDDIPAEFWRTLCAADSPAAEWVVQFCNLC